MPELVFRFLVKFYTPDPELLEEELTRFYYCDFFWPHGACVAGHWVAICFASVSYYLVLLKKMILSALYSRLSLNGLSLGFHDLVLLWL